MNRGLAALAAAGAGAAAVHPLAPTAVAAGGRVRSRLGVLVGHPRSMDVAVHEGRVTLRGPVLAEEVDRPLAGVARVRARAASRTGSPRARPRARLAGRAAGPGVMPP